MRNVDDDRPGQPRSNSESPADGPGLGTAAAAGVAGLAILGGVVAFQQTRDTGASRNSDVAIVTDASSGVTGPGPAPASTAADDTPATPSGTVARHWPTDAERIAALKGKAAKAAADGSQVRRPLGRVLSGTAPMAVKDLRTAESGSLSANGSTMKVVSARKDLTGYRELGWAADEGEKVGDARCTQNIRLSSTAAPRVRSTLLLCWRTSATRSVYTVLVDVKKSPSKAKGVAAIDDAWKRLG